MRIPGIILSFFCVVVCSAAAEAQPVWTLERCIQYAREHNISIRQSELNERLAALQLQQSRLMQLPNANIGGSGGRSFGRSIDPTSNQFVNTNYNYLGLSGNADVLLFGWFQKRRQIDQNRMNLEAARHDLDQLQDNVALNVATGYLRAVLAREQIGVNERQVALSVAQLNQTRRFADAGRVPELDVAQLESQVATDSANLIGALAEYNAAILDLKALLNLDFAEPFEVMPPDVEPEETVRLNELDPEHIYAAAAAQFGSVKSSQYRVLAAEKGLAAARGAQWPQIGISLQSGTNYASTFKEVTGYTLNPGEVQMTGSYVDFNGNQYPVYQPVIVPQMATTPVADQLRNNFRQTISLSLSVPLFNSWQAQYNVRRSRIEVLNQMLNREQTELTLKQDVYKAYNDAVNSLQKYQAARRAAAAAHRAFDFAQRRYDLGLTNAVEYLTTQNNQYRADASLASAKYDLIFRLKVIDYYLGKDLKL
jgi:outer membrane protein